MTRLIGLLLVVAAIPAQPQTVPAGSFDSVHSQTVQAPPEAPAGKGVLGGKVVNAKTKEPIRKAHVQLNGPTNLSAVTDSSGSFTFRALPAGGYMVNANHEDYYLDQSSMNMARQVTLADGAEKTDEELDLMPGASIEGRVLDEDEYPVPQCTVLAMRFDHFQGRPRFMGNNGGNTDDQGRYRLRSLQAGHYILKTDCHAMFSAPHGFMKRNDSMIPHEGYAPVFAGGGDPTAPTAGIPVTAGAELTGVDFHVKRVPIYVVRGTLQGIEQNMMPGAQLLLVPAGSPVAEDSFIPASYEAQRGQFVFRRVPAGSYELSATVFNMERAYQARQTIEVGKTPVTEFDLKLAPGAVISGTVDVDDPNQHFENMQISLQPLAANYRGPIPIATLGTGGAFEFKTVLPGHFTLNSLPMGYIKSLTLAGRDVDPRDFEVTGEGAGPMHIVVGSKMGKIEIDASPRPATGQLISALLIPDELSANLDGRNAAVGGPTGELAFPSVAPGKYHLVALATMNPWNLMNQPQILKSLQSHGTAVEIAEGDDKHISATVISADDIQKLIEAAE